MKYKLYNYINKANVKGIPYFPTRKLSWNYFNARINALPLKLSLAECRYLLKQNKSQKYKIAHHDNDNKRCKTLSQYIRNYDIKTI